MINESENQRDKLEIAQETDKIKTAVVKAINNSLGTMKRDELQVFLDNSLGSNVASVTENGEDFLIQINGQDRYYKVTQEGRTEYLGNTEEPPQIAQNLVLGKNIYSSNNNTANTYINSSNGNVTSYNGWSSSEYIDISNYDKLLIVSETGKFLSQWNALYDENKNFIKSITFSKKQIENDDIGKVEASIDLIDVESNQKYLRISEVSSALNSIKIYPVNSDFNGIINFGIGDDILVNYKYGLNMLQSGSIVPNTYISASNGQQIAYTNWSSTSYLDIKDCEQIIIASTSQSGFDKYDALYDVNKNYIKNPNLSSLPTNYSEQIGYYKILDVEQEVAYIRLSLSTTALNNIKVYPVRKSTEARNNIKISESLLNANSIINNIYIETDGTQTNYSGWSATDYIDIGNYGGIIIKNHSQNYNASYNSQKQFIANMDFSNKYIYNKQIGKVGAQILYMEPSNQQYVRLSQNTNALKNVGIYAVLNSDFDKTLKFVLK